MINPTNRTVQLARAIERLSARDMQVLVNYVFPSGIGSEKFRLTEHFLKFADEVFNAEYIEIARGDA